MGKLLLNVGRLFQLNTMMGVTWGDSLPVMGCDSLPVMGCDSLLVMGCDGRHAWRWLSHLKWWLSGDCDFLPFFTDFSSFWRAWTFNQQIPEIDAQYQHNIAKIYKTEIKTCISRAKIVVYFTCYQACAELVVVQFVHCTMSTLLHFWWSSFWWSCFWWPCFWWHVFRSAFLQERILQTHFI